MKGKTDLSQFEYTDKLGAALETLYIEIEQDVCDTASNNPGHLRGEKYYDQWKALKELTNLFVQLRAGATAIAMNPIQLRFHETLPGVKMARLSDKGLTLCFKWDDSNRKYLFHHYERQ